MRYLRSIVVLCATFPAELRVRLSPGLRNFHISRCLLFETYYDTLKLKRDCSHKEIREAFISLSKEHHPDKNINNPENHAQFVKLNEAYSVLSRPDRRADYDLSLVPVDRQHRIHKWQSKERRPFRDKSFWVNREKSEDQFYEAKPYYGIAGIKKMSNKWIVIFCLLFTFAGVSLQFLAIRESMTFKREKLDEMSMRNNLIHQQVRQQALENGTEIQLQLLQQQLLGSPNPNKENLNSVKGDV